MARSPIQIASGQDIAIVKRHISYNTCDDNYLLHHLKHTSDRFLERFRDFPKLFYPLGLNTT